MAPWVPVPPSANETWTENPSGNLETAFQADAFQSVPLAFQIGNGETWSLLPNTADEPWTGIPSGSDEPWSPLPTGADEIWT